MLLPIILVIRVLPFSKSLGIPISIKKISSLIFIALIGSFPKQSLSIENPSLIEESISNSSIFCEAVSNHLFFRFSKEIKKAPNEKNSDFSLVKIHPSFVFLYPPYLLIFLSKEVLLRIIRGVL